MYAWLLAGLVIAGTPTFTSTATTTTSSKGAGAALAWSLGPELSSGGIALPQAVERVLALPESERRAFFAAWPLARPSTPEALKLEAAVDEASRGRRPPALESPDTPAAPRLAPSLPTKPQKVPEEDLEYAREPLTTAEAFVLSLFLGFGSGNFVRGHFLMGSLTAMPQIIGFALIIASSGEEALLYSGIAILGVGRAADCGLVLLHKSLEGPSPATSPAKNPAEGPGPPQALVVPVYSAHW